MAEEPPVVVEDVPEQISGAGFSGVIADAGMTRSLHVGLGEGGPVEVWRPSVAQITELEAALAPFLAVSAALDPRAPALADKLASYKRQYGGVVVDGEQQILVNAFCHSTGDDWQSAPVIVDDGGDCYFAAYFVPARKTFVRLQINGEG